MKVSLPNERPALSFSPLARKASGVSSSFDTVMEGIGGCPKDGSKPVRRTE